ncbi:MAG TPA: histidine kinase, partial [Anaerolineae bacterium]|nr:histidine kinase [Anaerolineae bacterium]
AVAFAESDHTLRRDLLALGAVSVFALLAAWFGGNAAVVREVQHLVRTTKRLAAGDFAARTGLSRHSGELGQLAGSLDQMAGALELRERERRENEEALRQHSARTEALARAASRLNTQLDLPSVLNTVCSETAAALNAPAASVSLYDPQADVVRCVASYGLPPELQAQIPPLPRAAIKALAAESGMFQVADTAAAPDLPGSALYAGAGMRTCAGAVMEHEGELVGCLVVFALDSARSLGHDELAMLRGLADQAALAISNARLYHALQHEQRACEGLLAKVISAQEDERKRIARELHDETSQNLNALILSLDRALAAVRAQSPKAEEHLAAGKDIAAGALESVHRLVSDLRPSLLDDLGLVPAINWYGEERLKPHGIAMSMQCRGMDIRLPAAVETALFRIAQEAITNIARHSGATEVQVTLQMSDGRVRLVVEDNGRGFDVAAVAAVKHSGRGLGLRGMQERAVILGGECQIRSRPGGGTVISVEVPSGT